MLQITLDSDNVFIKDRCPMSSWFYLIQQQGEKVSLSGRLLHMVKLQPKLSLYHRNVAISA